MFEENGHMVTIRIKEKLFIIVDSNCNSWNILVEEHKSLNKTTRDDEKKKHNKIEHIQTSISKTIS